MNTTLKLKLLAATALLASSVNSAQASHCNISFNYGVVINPKHIRLIEHGQTRVQINQDHQLFINGIEQPLSIQQQHKLNRYSTALRQQVPNIIQIALDGVEIGLKAVNKIIANLTGENSASHQKIQEKFNQLQERLHLRFNQTRDNYFIAQQNFADFDELFAGEFEQELQAIVAKSVGTILNAVGQAINQEQNERFEQTSEQSNSLEQKLTQLSRNIELDLDKDNAQLDLRTVEFCQQLTQLNITEQQLQLAIPQLTSFDLINNTEVKK